MKREKKNRPQDNFKWEIKSGRKPCQNLLKNRFFSFKNVIKKYECFCDLLPSLFYRLSATQMYHTVQYDGWGLLIIFTEKQNGPCYTPLLKRWGIPRVHSFPHKVTCHISPGFPTSSFQWTRVPLKDRLAGGKGLSRCPRRTVLVLWPDFYLKACLCFGQCNPVCISARYLHFEPNPVSHILVLHPLRLGDPACAQGACPPSALASGPAGGYHHRQSPAPVCRSAPRLATLRKDPEAHPRIERSERPLPGVLVTVAEKIINSLYVIVHIIDSLSEILKNESAPRDCFLSPGADKISGAILSFPSSCSPPPPTPPC